MASSVFLGTAVQAQTLPTGGTVASGAVSISKPVGNTLNITQSSQNAMVNWQGFSIGGNSTVDISQPNSSAALLNRVTGNTSSTIAGQLNANGQVYLINPNGIAITKSGVVDVGGGFVASTLGISDEDFKNGKLHFSGNGNSAAVMNQGVISVGRGGYAALLGGSVNNAGLIAVPLGKVGLGAGEAATLDLSGDGFLQVAVPTASGSGASALIQSSGTIAATGGTLVMTAATARAAARNAINLSGVVEARSISGHDGAISLSGGAGGGVQVSGTLDVGGGAGDGMTGGAIARSAAGMNAPGGSVTITGEDIALIGASIDASGSSGGAVKIGGDLHGSGSLPTADTVSVDAKTVIDADARGSGTAGNGGSVVLWSNEDTKFAGRISATGGLSGGNGGDAEVSSKNMLQYSGSVDLMAPHGLFGTLLLDPYNVTIETGTTTGGTFGGGTFTAPSSNSILSVSDLQNALANASVTVTTGGSGSAGSDAGNITVANALTWASGSTLTLSAYHSITVEAPITITGNGGLHLTTNNGGSGGALTFWPGVSAEFTGVYSSTNDGGNSALDGTALGSLTINGNAYTLVNSMSGFAAMATSSGTYTALAIPLTSTTNYTHGVVSTYYGTFEGLGNTLSNLTINSTDADIGLFAVNYGTIRDFGLVGGTVTEPSNGASGDIGGLVGNNQTGSTLFHVFNTGNLNAYHSGVYAGDLVGGNEGTITSSYATGQVANNGTGDGQYGGLAGYNAGSINQCFATGSVNDYSNGAGGLVGFNSTGGQIVDSYATGAVRQSGGPGYAAGGLVGTNIGSIQTSFSTGVVNGTGRGGLVGVNSDGGTGTATNSYWDVTTSGLGSNSSTSSSAGGTGYATGSLTGSLPSGFSGTVWSTGSGLYPYLSSIFPGGVQALTGHVYSDAGQTLLSSGASGNVPVSFTVNGVSMGSATSSATGSYYFVVPAGTVTSSNALLVYSTAPTSSQSGADLGYALGSTGLDIYGAGFYDNTNALTYSTAGVATVLGYSTTPSFIGLLPLQINARGSSFTLDQTLSPSTNLTVTTQSGAPLTVAAPITVANGNTLWLDSGGALNINSGVTVPGTGAVSLTYSTASATNLSFAGGSVQFTGGSAGSPQGSLTINNTGYTLVNSMASLDAIDGTLATSGGGSVTTYGSGLAGNYALALPLTASGTYVEALVAIGGNSSFKFTGTFEGLGNTITGLNITESTSTSNDPALFGYLGLGGTVRDLGVVGGTIASTGSGGNNIGGLVGRSDGTIVLSYSSATVNMGASGGTDLGGGLVGDNFGSILASYATGTVTGGNNMNLGGLVGRDEYSSGGYVGTITKSYATGAVSGGTGSGIGGLSGIVYNGAAVTSSYSTGPVTGGSGSDVGGLVGQLFSGSTITQSYSTGAVSGAATLGGLLGQNNGTLTNSVWDTSTSGTTTGIGTGTNSGATGYTTSQLQSTSTSGVSLGSAFAGGAAGTANGGVAGVYPFLTIFYPNGVQAISGIAFKDAGITPLASGASGNGIVSVTLNGTAEGTSYTGANGYYYFLLPASTIPSSSTNILAYTQSGTGYGAVNGAAYAAVTGFAADGAVSGLNIYGGYSAYGTTATLYSQLGSAGSTVLSTVEGYTSTPAFVSTLGSAVVATGASFTVDQALTLSSNLALFTSYGAPLIVAQPITVSGSNSLTLGAGGVLDVNAGITVPSTGTVNLAYNTSSATNLSFGTGGSVQFTGTYGSANDGGNSALDGRATGTLTINGTAYTLVNSMAELDAIDGTLATSGGGSVTTYGSGLAGNYALALPLTATGTTYTNALIGTDSSSSTATQFTGTFEGLGNTVSGLTIAGTGSYTGLFGYLGLGGTVRDLGLVAGTGTISASGNSYLDLGALAGRSDGAIVSSYSTAPVTMNDTGASNWVGGLVGDNFGSILASCATGSVSSGNNSNVGGLVGRDETASSCSGCPGSITQSYATGAVSGAQGSGIGGLAGSLYNGNTTNPSPSYANGPTVSSSYATGPVTGGSGSNVGGLVGQLFSYSSINQSYATGALSGGLTLGGVLGENNGSLTNSVWDTSTSGTMTGIGTGTNSGATGYTTTQLQSTSTSGVSLGSAFAGGAAGTGSGGTSGVYPFLTYFYPNGVQSISGTAYRDVGVTWLASGASGNGIVTLTLGGTLEGTPYTGANGYYYLALPANSISSSGSNVLAFTQSGTGYNAVNGAAVISATGITSGLNVYGGYLNYPTALTTYSAASAAFNALKTTVTGYSTTPSFVSSLPPYFTATGASFTVDQSPGTLTTNFGVQTTATNASLIVAAPITLSGSNTLTLSSAGTLAIDANVVVSGAGTVNLSYNTSTALGNNLYAAQNFGFGPGDSLQFTGGTAGSPLGTLNIAGNAYTLINSMTQLASTSLTGYSALATPLTAPGTAYTAALIGTGSSGTSSTYFTGTFEGLGNTISALQINSTIGSASVGLFGYVGSAGTVRDLGLVGGNVTSSGNNNVNIGELAGTDAGAILQSYATGAVGLSGTGGSTFLGGLVGNVNAGTVTASYATGPITGSSSQNDGGLVGRISGAGTVSQSFATGAVTSGGNGGTGGLVGRIDANVGVVQYSYATGAVTATNNGGAGDVGGLVGQSSGQIKYSYATGAVTNASGSSVGGVVASNAGTVTSSYWDKSTSGITANGPTGTTGETTQQLQGSTTLTFGGGFTGGAAGGTSGIYPYLSTIYPTGIQAVSGTAYKDAGVMALASTANGAGLVSLEVGSSIQGTVSTGNNGYYYFTLPAGTISSSGSQVLAYTVANSTTGAKNAATLATETGTTVNFNIYGGDLLFTTSALSYSTAMSAASTAEAVAIAGGTSSGVFAGLAPVITATGASFTLDEALSPTGSYGFTTTATNAPLTVAQSLTLAGANTLTLSAAGALAIDAPITVSGAGAVALTYNTASPTNLTFAEGASINYGATNNGGTLRINGQAYHLLYKLTDSGAATGNGPDNGTDDIAGIDNNSGAGGDNGYYALATNLTGTGSATAAQFSQPLAASGYNSFNGVFEGLGHTITNLTINDSTDQLVGVFGTNGGTIRDLGLVGGSVVSSYSYGGIVGGLAGVNSNYANGGTALIANVYNTGSVAAVNFAGVGGLVGDNLGDDGTATIMNSYATGAVSSGGTGSYVGGLVGTNNGQSSGTATITNAYASGAVTGGANSIVGGIVGQSASGSGAASVNNVYATGAVTSAGGILNYLGGIVGNNSGSVSQAYWDSSTGGSGNGVGVGASAQALSTGQLQGTTALPNGVTVTLNGFAGGAVATANGGTTGVYPYLASFFPNGVQAVSGFAYTGINTPLASSSDGAVLVGVNVGGVLEGTPSTGLNGYYYLALPASTLTSTPATAVIYATAPTASQNGAALSTLSLSSATGAVAGPSVYAGFLNFPTAATTYSAASSAFTTAQSTVAGVTGSTFESALAPFITATGASFTVDQALSPAGGFAVQTTASNAPITVAQPLTLAGANTLILNAAGALAINAPITVSGAGAVELAYNTASPRNLTFAMGSSINYGATDNGGTLSINGQTYSLLYKLTDSVTATGNGPDGGTDDVAGIDNINDSGLYALATSVAGTGSASAPQFSSALVGAGSNSFSGVFEGLGNSITGLTINQSGSNAGLFGTVAAGGAVRDLLLMGASVAGTSYVGSLVGNNSGTVTNVYATGTVSGAGNDVGGLIGINNWTTGSVTNSWAAVNVTDTGDAVGGFAGENDGYLEQDMATGAVNTGGGSGAVGGMVGVNNGIMSGYSTGAVSAGSNSYEVGGYVGFDSTQPLLTGFSDEYTSGTTQGESGLALTTSQLQSTAYSSNVSLPGFAGGAAGSTHGGTTGEYPYLTNFFPNGVQAISGYAYTGIGPTKLASGLAGAALVGVSIGGTLEGTVATGANGYYYLMLPPGTLTSTPATTVVYSTAPSSSQSGAALASLSLSSSTGPVAGPSVYGGYLNLSTAATTYSAASSAFTSAQSTVAGVTGSTFESALAPFITATGASFTFDQALNLSSSFAVQTTASNAPITVSSPITLSGANALTLDAAGALAINSPITVSGAGAVALTYNTASPTNLTFAQGSSLIYATNGSGSLSINGQAYTLLYKLTDSGATTGNGTDTGTDDIAGIDNAGDSGFYALATSLTGTGSAAAAQFSHSLAGSGSNSFAGVFEGLGNTISNLTINSSDAEVGLFGTSSGTVRDIGLIGGSVSASASGAYVGDLVGKNANLGAGGAALVVNSYASGSVSGASNGAVGGLVGGNYGGINGATVENSFTTGAVSGGSYANIGGLVGYNVTSSGAATLQSTYAAGAVTGGFDSDVGGLVGGNHAGTVQYGYATGAVSGGTYLGGVVGYNQSSGTVIDTYWDSTTSGQSAGSGGGGGSVQGLTTGQLQGTASLPNGVTVTLPGFAGGAAATANGGTNGAYPYLASFFPSGVQSISGLAYTNSGATTLTSGTNGAGWVSVASGGVLDGASTTGANGYYYVAVPAGTFTSGQNVVAFTQANGATGALDAAQFTQSGGGSSTTIPVYGGWMVERAGSITTLSALNSAYSTAVGSTAAASVAPANVQITRTGGFGIDTSLTASGTILLSFTGAVTESGNAALSAANLLLAGSGGSFTLNNTNTIGTLAASTGSLSLVDGSSVSTGSLNGAAGAVTSGVTTTGTLNLVSGGAITLASGDGVSAQSPVLAAAGAFVNNAGASGVTATSGRWLIYSNAPGNDTFGSLNSSNTAIFGQTYSSLPPGSVSQSGDRYVFANQPVLTVTPTSDTKVYGVDDGSSIAGDYSITGFPSVSGVFLADTASNAVTGSATVTSAGSTQYAPVSGSPYAMSASVSGLSATGYGFQAATGGTLTVTPATVTVFGVNNVNKTYDGTTTVLGAGYGVSGFFLHDALNVGVTAASDVYASPNYGLQNINVSGVSLTGSAAGNYMLSTTSVTGSGTISQAVINLGGTRAYDATTVANASLFGNGGVISGVDGQLLTLTGSGTLTAATVGNQPLSALGSLTLGNGGSGSTAGLASNYTLVGGNDSLNVTPAVINLSGTRVYDATPAANAAVFGNAGVITGVAGQLLTLSGSGTLAVKTVGNEPVTALGSLTLGNGGSGGTAGVASNYTLVGGTDSVNVTPLGITVTATAANKVYDATTAASVSLASGGVLPNDMVTLGDSSATFDTANAGTGKTVTVAGLTLGGADGGNYTVNNANATATTTANITPAVINLSGTRVYDATTAANASLFGNAGVITGVAGQLLSLSGSGTLAAKTVGNEAVTALGSLTLSNGGTGGTAGVATNYTLVGGTDSVNVTPLGITVTASAANKVYDATTAASVSLASNGVLPSDMVTLGDSSATFDTANAGTAKTVTVAGLTLGGADGGNYTVNNANATAITTANISPVVINLSGTRVYDATTAANAALFGSAGTLSGVAGQLLSLSGSGTLAAKTVGTEPMTLGSLTLGNGGSGGTAGLASNYTLVGGTDSVDVTPLAITVTATANNKVYDGTAAATVSLSSSGVLANDVVSFADTSATFDSRNVGTGKTVTVGGLSLGGAAAGNYLISNANDTATTTANITPATITVAGATGVNKSYDGNTTLPAGASGFTSSGVLPIDAGAVTVAAANAAYASANVGPEAVNVAGLALSGAAAGNYVVSAGSVTGSGNIAGATSGGSFSLPALSGGSGGSGSGGGGSGGASGSGGAGGYALSGRLLSSSTNANGTTATVAGTLSNGIAAIEGTFIVQPRSSVPGGSLPYEIAGDAADIVTYVPGTLSAQLLGGTSGAGGTGNGFASAAVAAVPVGDVPPADSTSLVFLAADDVTQPWKAIDTFGNPGFDGTIVCVKGHCALLATAADKSAVIVGRGR